MTVKHNTILKIIVVVALGLMVCLVGCSGNGGMVAGNGGGGGGGSFEKAKGPAIGVSPAEQTVGAGEAFDVDVMVKSTQPLSGAGCQLEWSGEGKIECVDKIEEGDYFKSAGKTMMVGGKYDAASGTQQQIAVTIMATEEDIANDTIPGAEGEGTLFTFHFEALEPGEVTLEVFDVQLVDTDANFNVLESTSYNGKIVVE